MTKYVVLSKSSDAEPVNSVNRAAGVAYWKTEKMVDAVSAQAAVAIVAKELSSNGGPKEGFFVAVPVRSWKQVKVLSQNKVTLSFS